MEFLTPIMEEEIAYNPLFAETVGDRAALWIAPDTPHIAALQLHPDEYTRRVFAFLDSALLPTLGR